MGFTEGQFVLCTAGREKGKLMYIVKTDEKYVYLADGKERTLSKAKRKNPKHVKSTGIKADKMLTDKMLRSFLREV